MDDIRNDFYSQLAAASFENLRDYVVRFLFCMALIALGAFAAFHFIDKHPDIVLVIKGQDRRLAGEEQTLSNHREKAHERD